MKTFIEIKSANLRQETTRKGNVISKQQAAMFANGSDYPTPFFVTTDTPYKPGKYQLAGESFRVGRFGGLELDPYNIRLEPLSD